jgi:hypothetical protein
VLVNDNELDFLDALLSFVVSLLEVELLVEEQVREAEDSPPEDFLGDLVHLLGELINQGGD